MVMLCEFEGLERKQLLSISSYYPSIHLEVVRKIRTFSVRIVDDKHGVRTERTHILSSSRLRNTYGIYIKNFKSNYMVTYKMKKGLLLTEVL